ncbi:hypothetical protein DSO57_1027511 [Entomophthora muscae]|uniref:Uncharacterized protein n=1 Tax=Entomophthora muscae TaxID=34485 RepID=A0ACC2UB83_9FUNG|nr:hypothetical protein DSO57_1027511 [Entomophthora muscae]
MNHLIFTAVLTACLGIGGYQQSSEFFGPSTEGLGYDPYHDPGQLNSLNTGPWLPLVSPPFDTLHSHVYFCLLHPHLLCRELWTLQHTHQSIILANDSVSHNHRLGGFPVLQFATIHTPSGAHHSRKASPPLLWPLQDCEANRRSGYKLELPPTWKIHNVFHQSLLFKKDGTSLPHQKIKTKPPPIQEGRSTEYKVEYIHRHRLHYKTPQYYVKWAGYPPQRKHLGNDLQPT